MLLNKPEVRAINWLVTEHHAKASRVAVSVQHYQDTAGVGWLYVTVHSGGGRGSPNSPKQDWCYVVSPTGRVWASYVYDPKDPSLRPWKRDREIRNADYDTAGV